MKRRDLLKGLFGTAAAAASVAAPGVARLSETAVKQVQEGLTHAQRVAMERQIRVHVSSTGGFRKDINPRDITHCENLLAIVGRVRPEWDFNLHVPGFEDSESIHRPKKV